LISYLTFI
jgi:L-amino acid N-acyltransferase YncA